MDIDLSSDTFKLEDSWSLFCEEDVDVTGIDNYLEDEKFYGFSISPNTEKLKILQKIINNLKSQISYEIEEDVVDGLTFLSFSTVEELMEFTKLQQDQRATASQSDDGLEIMDDGSFSDMSSSHAIVPTKTKDITRIKGWRNKHFAGIHLCDDSGSSLRNEDDGFGDDFEIKSVQEESSEEVDLGDYVVSTSSKCESDAESPSALDIFSCSTYKKDSFSAIDSSIVEDTNAVDNTSESVFGFRKSNNIKSLDSLKTTKKHHLLTDYRNKISPELSFNNKIGSMKHNFEPDEDFHSSQSVSDKVFLRKPEDLFISPTSVQNKSLDKNVISSLANKGVYKPRVKHTLIESIAQKINTENATSSVGNSISTTSLPRSNSERSIRWHVPKEKLLTGNIFDVEVSVDDTDKKTLGNEIGLELLTSTKALDTFGSKQITNLNFYKQSIQVGSDRNQSNNGAFQSRTLEQYTTHLSDLHIDFTIPKLDAADNVTHAEIELPSLESMTTSPSKNKIKPLNKIKAKTVAEKRRLLVEMNKRTKRMQKTSFKLRGNSESKSVRNLRHLRGRTISKMKDDDTEKKTKNKTSLPQNKIQLFKSWCDENGVITYGREKPLMCRLTQNPLSVNENVISKIIFSMRKQNLSNDIGLIVNVGFKRPLYKEIDDNVKSLFTNENKISLHLAEFAVAAVQSSNKGPFTVTRFLVPVVSEELKQVMYHSTLVQTQNQEKSLTRTLANGCQKDQFDENCFGGNDLDEMSKRTNDLPKNHGVHFSICSTMNEMLNFIERKERFNAIDIYYDPDIPAPIEKESDKVFNSLQKAKVKNKKTPLQRQIEHLGGTFIAVQGEETSEEMLSQSTKGDRCLKEYCKLGCVCPYKVQVNEHCGKESCMFFCKCSPNSKKQGCEIKSKTWLLPEVLRQKHSSQSRLAPVEREYHQTVIMSRDKKIITIETKRSKRERKIPSKFKDEILLDYRKGDEEDLIIEKTVGPSVKLNHQNHTHPQNASISSSQFLVKVPNISTFNSSVNLTQCYVKLKRDEVVDEMAKLMAFTRGVFMDVSESPTKSKSRSRNVAIKKTGGRSSHNFDVENHCSRTFGVGADYTSRNKMYTIRTKAMTLFVEVPHNKEEESFIMNSEESCVIKEDLQCEDGYKEDYYTANDLICLENMTQEGEIGLAIGEICSLPPEFFEKQDTIDFDENINDLNLYPERDSTECDNRLSSDNNNQVCSKKKSERIVYASLPITETESKWWVIEMDVKKFSNLIYYSDKRCLNFEDMAKAIFKAEFGRKTVRIPLKKFYGDHKDKFGAYAVPGHKHLIFFGPYDINEMHGLTAIKKVGGVYTRVLFTSKFSESEGFKSLGIDLSHNKNDSQVIHQKCVKAVWWYSTNRKQTPENETEEITEVTRNNNTSSNVSTSRKTHNKEDTDAESTIHFASPVKETDLTIDRPNSPVELNTEDNVLSHHILENVTDIQPPVTSPKISKNRTLNLSQEVVTVTNDKFESSKKNTKRTITRKRKRSMSPEIINKIRHTKPNGAVIPVARMTEDFESIIDDSTEDSTDSFSDFSDDCSLESDFEEPTVVDHTIKCSNVKRIIHRTSKAQKQQSIKEPPTLESIPQELLMSTPSTDECPERALLCLTPSVGYLPVVEFINHKKIVIQDPAYTNVEHQFANQAQATSWLNSYFRQRFTFTEDFEMKWYMMKGVIIKYLKPMNPNMFTFKPKTVEISSKGVESLMIPSSMTVKTKSILERERRLELRGLLNLLAEEVSPETTEKIANQQILNTAVYTITAQEMLALEMNKLH